jgi:hypothetical protein
MFIVVSGNPVDGVTFFGPFSDAEVADDWAVDYLNNTGGDWWVSSVKPTHDL